jgi:hypothetical protein
MTKKQKPCEVHEKLVDFGNLVHHIEGGPDVNTFKSDAKSLLEELSSATSEYPNGAVTLALYEALVLAIKDHEKCDGFTPATA